MTTPATANDAAERLRLTITSQQARLGERITAGMLNALAEALAYAEGKAAASAYLRGQADGAARERELADLQSAGAHRATVERIRTEGAAAARVVGGAPMLDFVAFQSILLKEAER